MLFSIKIHRVLCVLEQPRVDSSAEPLKLGAQFGTQDQTCSAVLVARTEVSFTALSKEKGSTYVSLAIGVAKFTVRSGILDYREDHCGVNFIYIY